MTKLRTYSLLAVALFGLTACGMSEGAIDADSDDGIFLITHTTKGTLYWE